MSNRPHQEYKIERNYVALGEYLKYLRMEAGLTQREVSLALDYSSAQVISNFEKGIALPPLKKLKALQKIYRADTEKLIELTVQSERMILSKTLKSQSRS